MTVEVRYFASLVDRTGTPGETVDVRAGETVEALWVRLRKRHPGLGSIGFRPLVACDMEYSSWGRTLDGVREVAFLPPVSGG